ncbi:hypothetical protein C0Q70_00664 [Pomacea canaliculata]|uniref:Protein SHQ1 homolog n=1 Tax=Pomacea canaliculata TaxID=400727 RepID=A0A2T7PXA9_POMCA|nr:protein SHQ1 homolog [Pomacea canaliculata]PVD38054.1 hypothetical protein C0Q70_00664 [Pomacea canaliculata]
MLTPRFELSQDDEYLFLQIHAPFAKVSDTEFFIEDLEIRFFSTPYYLRLHLPKPVIEDGRASVKYDVDKGMFTAKIPKLNSGEDFEGLDMLTKLLTPPGETSAKRPTIEVHGESNCELTSDVTSSSDVKDNSLPHTECLESGSDFLNADLGSKDQSIEVEEEEEFQWYIEQAIHQEGEVVSLSNYGFASQRSGVFTKLMSEFSEILDVRDPDKLTAQEKRVMRLDHETHHFSEDHYLADLFDNDSISDQLNFKPWWMESGTKCSLSDDEKDLLLRLPKRHYIIDSGILPSVYFGLVDIIFAYAYNQRMVEGEDNVESGWSIAKLSSTLSWLENFTSLQDVLVSCYRRALTFPLHRNWALCEMVLKDVKALFMSGKLFLLKCLLDVHRCMIISDPRYIFNDLYITDYCVWIQSADDKKIQSLAKALADVQVTKIDVGFELEELEAAAAVVLDRENICLDTIISQMNGMQLNNQAPTLDSDDDGGSSDDDEEEEEEEEEDDGSDDDDDDEEENKDKEEKEEKENKGTDSCD